MQYALELKNVHYAYHTLEGETYALKDITFSVREGEFIALVGPSVIVVLFLRSMQSKG